MVLAAAGLLSSCAGSSRYTGSDVGGRPQRFGELRLGSRTAGSSAGASAGGARKAEAAAPPALAVVPSQAARKDVIHDRAAPPSAVATSAVSAEPPASIANALRRLEAFLAAHGFQFDDDGAGPAEVVTATRMMDGAAQAEEAACVVKALHRPAMSSTTLVVRLSPSLAGVDLGVQARFVEMDSGVVSGALSKRACRSRGVLEAKVRRAAGGG